MRCRPRLRTCLAADKNNMLGGAIIREGAGTVTLSLSLLTVEIIMQFLLEQTVLEKYIHSLHLHNLSNTCLAVHNLSV